MYVNGAQRPTLTRGTGVAGTGRAVSAGGRHSCEPAGISGWSPVLSRRLRGGTGDRQWNRLQSCPPVGTQPTWRNGGTVRDAYWKDG
ncbi:hypothetical protein GCM10025331_55200 [Actinoplanes utahensis]|nr:hypothetical protein Aut01nite_61790 [Actinoplanes utahensis]